MSEINNFWDLIAAKLHGELGQDEENLFNKALEDSHNKVLFFKAGKIREGVDALKKIRQSDRKSSWNIIVRKLRKDRIRRYSISVAKYAALIIFTFLLGIYFTEIANRDTKIAYTEFEVLDGQTGHLFLFDGTEVWLNSGTIFKYPNHFNQQERDVYIDGEAYFKVTPNRKIPFKVKTSEFEVEVLGTSFNVSAYHDEEKQSVVLEEGKVQINNLEGDVIGKLVPGQIALHSHKTALQIENINPYTYTSWKDGKVVFNAEKLGDIAQKLERWYNVEISFDQESLKDYKFSGTILRNKPINQTIMALELLAPIHFIYQVRTNDRDLITIITK